MSWLLAPTPSAALEAAVLQPDAMTTDSGIILTPPKVDGGMVVNDTFMQFEADMPLAFPSFARWFAK